MSECTLQPVGQCFLPVKESALVLAAAAAVVIIPIEH